MKKLISLLLALAMIMSLSITAFADETDVTAGSYNTDVTGTYVEGNDSNGTVFSVDIKWTGMNFTYYAEKGPVWNTEDHTYSAAEPARWEGTGTITVTNHSNTRISATPAYTKETGYETVEIEFDKDKLTLVSADIDNTAVTNTIIVTPGGSLPAISNDTNSAKIGTITVTIAEDPNVTVEEAEALVALIRERNSAWIDAGLNDEDPSSTAITVCNTRSSTLQMVIDDIKDGTGNQERLNGLYDETLAAYEEVESYMPAN